jgi:hypothetical protein
MNINTIIKSSLKLNSILKQFDRYYYWEIKEVGEFYYLIVEFNVCGCHVLRSGVEIKDGLIDPASVKTLFT